jgi:serine/threonine protein kinase
MDSNTRERLGNYRLVQRLGAGGFSQVYLGEHLYLNTSAAIKVLHSRLFDDASLNDFLAEARIIAQLDHPHIVRVLEFGVEDSIPYLVLQYAPNGTVRQRYPKGSRVQQSIILQYVKQIAEALQYAHDLKIIHRDIKPENLLLGKNDEILLSDFGLAIPSQSSIGVPDQERAGTAVYMAPEQMQGKSSRASDQYALGVVVYELLCGYPPFRGTASEILYQHIYEPPLPLREVMPTIPAAIEQVVMRTLAKEPSERFPQIQDFARALEEAYLKQDAIAPPSQDQPQMLIAGQLPLTDEVQLDEAMGTQQAEHGSFPTVSSPPSVLPEGQAAASPGVHRWPAAASTTKRMRPISRRAAVAAGMLGLAVLGGGAALYLFDSQDLWFAPALSHVPPHSTAKSRGKGTAHPGTGGTGNTSGAGHNGTGSSSSQKHPPSNNPQPGQGGGTHTQPTATAGSGQAEGGAGSTPPLAVQIDNRNALAQANINSSQNVQVTCSQSGAPTTVNVTYSNGETQNLGTQATDGNGNATFAWDIHVNGLLGVSLSATLVASATGTNGQAAYSNPVAVTILLNIGGLARRSLAKFIF